MNHIFPLPLPILERYKNQITKCIKNATTVPFEIHYLDLERLLEEEEELLLLRDFLLERDLDRLRRLFLSFDLDFRLLPFLRLLLLLLLDLDEPELLEELSRNMTMNLILKFLIQAEPR